MERFWGSCLRFSDVLVFCFYSDVRLSCFHLQLGFDFTIFGAFCTIIGTVVRLFYATKVLPHSEIDNLS